MNLPSFEECESAVDKDTATPLQRFIYDNEPAGREQEEEFRAQLITLLDSLAGEATVTAPQTPIYAHALARRFHTLYEALVPKFGYETRKESAKPWSAVPEKNRLLMEAVCEEIIKEYGLAARLSQGAQTEPLAHDADTFFDHCECYFGRMDGGLEDAMEYLAGFDTEVRLATIAFAKSYADHRAVVSSQGTKGAK